MNYFVILVDPKTGILVVSEGLEVANKGIDTVERGFDVFTKILDRVVPWLELNRTISKLDEFQSDFSKEAGGLISDVKFKMEEGLDAYSRATQSVSEWCALAVNLLNTYKLLFTGQMNAEKFDASRLLLLDVLDDGIAKMTIGINEMTASSEGFNAAIGQLTSLNKRLAYDFDSKSAFYQSELKRIRAVGYGVAAPFMLFGVLVATGYIEGNLIPAIHEKMASIEKWYKGVTVDVQMSLEGINETKAKLKDEIERIVDVRTETKITKVNVQQDDNPVLREMILQSVTNLIAKCEAYRARHTK